MLSFKIHLNDDCYNAIEVSECANGKNHIHLKILDDHDELYGRVDLSRSESQDLITALRFSLDKLEATVND